MQRSFDELGTPLAEVTFAVIDLETTGGSPAADAITEVGAVKLRGGECLGTFQTLVNPGSAIPRSITFLTGITESMVSPAPPIHRVLPSLVEFIAGTVIVGHNVRFDVGFLNTALTRHEWPRLANPIVDTVALARRLIRDDVPNCALGTLAARLRLDHRPSHRALDDALATADLLHHLLERAAAWGVLGLDDLLGLPAASGHPQSSKLSMTTKLPRQPGVYCFLDARGTPLYVGKAANLRQRVRSYFSSDDRRKIGGLLRETADIRHHVASSTLEAAVLEARLIHRLKPRYNRQGTGRRRPPYVALTLRESFPRLKIVTAPRRDGALYLGPLPSNAAAVAVVEGIQSVVPLRRCTEHLGPRCPVPRRTERCLPAQLGVASCPCAGDVTAQEYAPMVRAVVDALTGRPGSLLDQLSTQMHARAAARRYEEAAMVRERAAALSAALRRGSRVEALRRAGRIRLGLPGGVVVELDGGVFRGVVTAGAEDRLPFDLPVSTVEPLVPIPTSADGPDGAREITPELAVELLTVATWLDREGHRTRLLDCDGVLASPWPALPTFAGGIPALPKPTAA